MDDDYELPHKQRHPTGSLPGASTTPLWHSAQLFQTESAIRSTLPPPSCIDSIPKLSQQPTSPATPRTQHSRGSDVMAIENLINPPDTFTFAPSTQDFTSTSGFTPVNTYKMSRPRNAPINSASYHLQTGHFLTDIQVDMYQIHAQEVNLDGQSVMEVDESLMVDKNDGRVWHLGSNIHGSYSGTFVNDDPNKIYTEARNIANRLKEESERAERLQIATERLAEVRKLVSEGCILSVERTSFVEDGEAIICERPGCYHQGQLPADAYYVNVGDQLMFCLRCFEMLWAGKFTGGAAMSDPFRRDSAIAFTPAQYDGPAEVDYLPQFDGPEDFRDALRRSARLRSNSSAQHTKTAAIEPQLPVSPTSDLFKSRWSVPEDQTQYASPACTPQRQPTADPFEDQPANPDSSPSSIYSNGEWIYPPAEVQQIAHLLTTGVTLSEIDKCAVLLWQAMSRTQLRWERHLWRVKARRAYYARECDEDEGLTIEKLELGLELEWEQLVKVQQKLGMRTKDYYGRELSFVLKEAATKMKEKATKA